MDLARRIFGTSSRSARASSHPSASPPHVRCSSCGTYLAQSDHEGNSNAPTIVPGHMCIVGTERRWVENGHDRPWCDRQDIV